MVNDGSVRDYPRKTHRWTTGRNFDGTGTIGPFVATPDEVPDAAAGLIGLSETRSETPALPPEPAVAAARNDCHLHTEDRENISDTITGTALEEIGSLIRILVRSERDLDRSGEMAALFMGAGEDWKMARTRHGRIGRCSVLPMGCAGSTARNNRTAI